jgi:hypothetical protein
METLWLLVAGFFVFGKTTSLASRTSRPVWWRTRRGFLFRFVVPAVVGVVTNHPEREA